jgi:hypothetical protein
VLIGWKLDRVSAERVLLLAVRVHLVGAMTTHMNRLRL